MKICVICMRWRVWAALNYCELHPCGNFLNFHIRRDTKFILWKHFNVLFMKCYQSKCFYFLRKPRLVWLTCHGWYNKPVTGVSPTWRIYSWLSSSKEVAVQLWWAVLPVSARIGFAVHCTIVMFTVLQWQCKVWAYKQYYKIIIFYHQHSYLLCLWECYAPICFGHYVVIFRPLKYIKLQLQSHFLRLLKSQSLGVIIYMLV
jgi:hypothetical protein